MKNPYKIPYVSLANGRVVYSPRVTTKEFKDVNLNQDSRGFLKPPIRLGKQGDPHDKIMAEYLKAKKSLLEEDILNKQSLGYISETYQNSHEFSQLKGSTQTNYINSAKVILAHPLRINKEDRTLADLKVTDLTKPMMNEVRKARLDYYQSKGQKGTVVINNQVTYLVTAIAWGLNNISALPSIANPLTGIKKFKTEPNKRYVTDEELEIQCKFAAEVREYLPTLIRLNYYLGARGIETINLRESNTNEHGIDVDRTKGSMDNTIKWFDSLRSVVEEARAYRKTFKITDIDPTIIVNSTGRKVTQSAVQNAMSDLKKLMKEKGLEKVFFTLHKTKSKMQSDSKDDKVSGLKTDAMKARYTTKKQIIDTGLE